MLSHDTINSCNCCIFRQYNWLESALIKFSKFESDNSFVKSVGNFFFQLVHFFSISNLFLLIRSNRFNLLYHFIYFSKDVIHNIHFILFILTFICILIFNFCSGFFFFLSVVTLSSILIGEWIVFFAIEYV